MRFLGKVWGFNQEVSLGNSGASKTINLADGNKQTITISQNTALTVSSTGAPVGNYILRLVNNGAFTVTWSGLSAFRWLGASSAPAINSGVGNETIVSIYFDGTNMTQSLAKVGAA